MSKRAYFMDFELETENSTLFPRPETEILVEKAVELLLQKNPEGKPYKILDIGTGCGNIAISLTNYIPSSRMVALDISDTSLRVAERNAARYGVESRIEFIKSDLFENMRERSGPDFHLIISNPPYVSRDDFVSLSEEVKDEPFIALYGGPDGLDFFRRIALEAPFFLKEEGLLLMEVGYNQAPSVKAILESTGAFKEIEAYKDYSGMDRIVKSVNANG